jgi:hypothetical protein
MEDGCKTADKLDLVHKWIHTCFEGFGEKELEEAHQLGEQILNLLNDADKADGIKVLALFEALSVGADTMEKQLTARRHWVGTHETIH